ncbi:hypothetical protein VI817_005765 [Penicillium citrinum]|uniref:Uncharacterized protein n=1 Tax=Penicillium hetheringtonii TaxID=911720 RepID=A0AAD6DG54_9EURO|nr:hypothetical protein N7450_009127 [Penicillium hetheringtonii]KAK5796480.1 hypothetical protein VI817_005765 [Penicillium citrinum]
MQNLLSISRMAVGLGFLTVPGPFASVFVMPFSPEAAIGCKMAGSRDLVLGALLYYTYRRQSSTLRKDKVTNPVEQSPLLNSEDRAGHSDNSVMRLALISGVVVDTLDVIMVLWCYLDGTLPIEAVATLGGGACILFGMGVYCWHWET